MPLKADVERRLAELQEQINQRALDLISRDPVGAALLGAQKELSLWAGKLTEATPSG